jgi:hypothetical protein
MKSNSVLFWPGRGNNLSNLYYFLFLFKFYSYKIERIPFEYDKEDNPLYLGSKWEIWLRKNTFTWWIGISLGASLAYTFASLLTHSTKPQRLTLINPFASRRVLAAEKGFSMAGQWDFSPIDYESKLNNIEIIVSLFDIKIPMYHSILLYNKSISDNKKLIFIKDNHQVNNYNIQIRLAEYLIFNNN